MSEASSIEELLENLQALVRDSEALLSASASYANGGMHEARAHAEESLRAAKQRLAQFQDLFGKAREAMETGQSFLRDNPWATIACAAGLGLLLGTLLTRRRS